MPPGRAAELTGRPLHPVPLDAALQAVAALAAPAGGEGTQVPFALRELEVLGPVPAVGWAHVVREGDRFTVRLADRDGRVGVRFGGLALRSLRPGGPAPGPAVAAPGPGGTGTVESLVHLPEWRDAPPVAGVPADRPSRVRVVHGPGTADLAAALVAAAPRRRRRSRLLTGAGLRRRLRHRLLPRLRAVSAAVLRRRTGPPGTC